MLPTMTMFRTPFFRHPVLITKHLMAVQIANKSKHECFDIICYILNKFCQLIRSAHIILFVAIGHDNTENGSSLDMRFI